tara:strand:- start:2307 stop:2543 length:237 start_codon:yes stop_codon:yes gene_type:complete
MIFKQTEASKHYIGTVPMAKFVTIKGQKYQVVEIVKQGKSMRYRLLNLKTNRIGRSCHAPTRKIAVATTSGERIEYHW